MPNFMTGFMRGYDFVDRNKRLDRDEKRLEEDRQLAKDDRQRRLSREDTLWNQRQKAIDEQEKLRGLQGTAYLLDSPDFLKNAMAGDEQTISALNEYASKDPRIQSFVGMLDDPENLPQVEQDIATLESGFKGGAKKQDVIDAANRVLQPFLNYGDGGENKRLVDIYPSQSGKGFYAELEMEENGTTKRAPLTGPNRSPEDTELKEIPAAKLAQSLGLLKQYINSQRVALGDTSPLASRAEGRQADREHALKTAEQINKHVLEMEKLSKEYDLKEKLEKAKVKSGTSGNAPADQQLTEYLVNTGIYPDRKSAWAAVRKSKSDPVKIAADIAMKEIKAQNDALIGPGDDGYRSPDQIRRDALTGVVEMYQSYYGTDGQKPAADDDPLGLFK